MSKRTRVLVYITAMVSAPLGAHGAPALLPVQGYLTDAEGIPVDGDVSVTFTIHTTDSGGAALFLEQQTVAIDEGAFTAYLGAGANPLDLDLFAADELWLGIRVGADPEMIPRFRLGTAPYAAFSRMCEDAERLDGHAPADFAAAQHAHSFSSLTGIPAGLSDGDDDTRYLPGAGLVLNGAELSVSGQVIESYARAACFDTEDELTAVLDGRYAAAGHTQDWSTLAGVPAGFADGVDDDTTYTAGAGLNLVGSQLNVSGVTGAMITNGSITGDDIASTAVLNVARVDYSTPRVHRVVVGEADFRSRWHMVQVGCCAGIGGAYIENGATDTIVAPVTLPVGARITRATFHYRDNDAALNLHFHVFSHSITFGTYSIRGELETSGADPAVRSAELDLPDHVVLATESTQILAASIGSGGSTAPWPAANHSVFGVVVEYTLAQAP